MKTYREKLKDPRWQKMRLSILERDEFTCRVCFDSSSTLHIHHRYYSPVENPWDYPPHALVTLCENCHEVEGSEMPAAGRSLIDALKEAGAMSADIDGLANAILVFIGDKNQSLPLDFRFWDALQRLIFVSRENPHIIRDVIDWYADELAAARKSQPAEGENE